MHAAEQPPRLTFANRLRQAFRPEVIGLLLLALAIGTWVYENRSAPTPVDDALIFFRYARNLVRGHGLVFNVGERVEGFTSLTWVLLLAAGMFAGFSAHAVSHVLGVLSGALMLVLTYAYASTNLERSRLWIAGVASWMVLASTCFAYWSTAGLETPLFGAAVSAALVAQARKRPGWATLASIFATLTRPEGVLVGAVVIWYHMREVAWRRQRAWLMPAAFAASLVTLTAFRLGYFGAPLPNTFYAKVGDVPIGWTWFNIESFLVQIFAPVAVPAVMAMRHEKTRALRPGVAWFFAVSISVLFVGGDYFEHSRFFFPVLPVVVTLAVHGAVIVTETDGTLQRLALACIPVTLIWYFWGTVAGVVALASAALVALRWMQNVPSIPWIGATCVAAAVGGAVGHVAVPKAPKIDVPFGVMTERLLVFTRNGELERLDKDAQTLNGKVWPTINVLKARKPRLVAATGIGLIGYETDLPIIDILGLTEPAIARKKAGARHSGVLQYPGHQRSNADYVLGHWPEYIIIPEDGDGVPVPAILDLWAHPAFQDHYVWDAKLSMYRLRSTKP